VVTYLIVPNKPKSLLLPAAPFKVLGAIVLVGVVLVRTLTIDVVLVVHLFSLSLRLMFGLLTIEEIFTLCLCKFVLNSGMSSQHTSVNL
jgi:hypothetical protein